MSPRIGLIANHGKAGAEELVHEIVADCAGRSLTLVIEANTARLAGLASKATPSDLARECDLLLVLGGDGTILQVLHELCDKLPPILGINLGTLGFLTCVSAAAWRDALDAIDWSLYRTFVSPALKQ